MAYLDLREMYGNKYKIVRDAGAESRDMDAWLWIIPCKHGEIFSPGWGKLAVLCNNSRIRVKMLAGVKGLEPHQIGDTESIHLFEPDMFKGVARFVRPKLRRRASPEQRERLAIQLVVARRIRQNHIKQGSKPPQSNDLGK